MVEGALRLRLPDAPWSEAVVHLGYSVGFLMVILGRMQLFTEQTIVAALPAMADPSRQKLLRQLQNNLYTPQTSGVFYFLIIKPKPTTTVRRRTVVGSGSFTIGVKAIFDHAVIIVFIIDFPVITLLLGGVVS